MPFHFSLRSYFEPVFRPIVQRLVEAGVRPGLLTSAYLLGSIIVGVAVSQAQRNMALLLLLPGWLASRAALSTIDSMLESHYGTAAGTNTVLTEVAAVMSDIALYLPLGFLGAGTLGPALAFCCGAALTEICGVMSLSMGSGRRRDGPAGNSERAVFVSILATITYFVPQALGEWPTLLTAAAILTLLTCLNRIAHALSGRE